MPINTLAYAQILQTTLDKAAVRDACTGWMDANAGKVKYSGGNEVKIPKMSTQGLGDYDRDDGYAQGSVSLSWETRAMTQDRGRKFQLDAMDVDETSFVATAAAVMGEFQRNYVVPEIDAYRIAKIASQAITADVTGMVTDNQTIAANLSTLGTLRAIKTGISKIRDKGYNEPLVIHATDAVLLELEIELAGKLQNITWSQGGVNTQVPAVDGVPIIPTPANRMVTAITLYDGKTAGATAAAAVYKQTADARLDSTKTYYTRSGSDPNYTYTKVTEPNVSNIATYYELVSPEVTAAADQTGGGYVKGGSAKDINFMILPRSTPIAVTKQDIMRIFDPQTNQKANAWAMDYRRYHDLWILDNRIDSVYINAGS